MAQHAGVRKGRKNNTDTAAPRKSPENKKTQTVSATKAKTAGAKTVRAKKNDDVRKEDLVRQQAREIEELKGEMEVKE